MRSLIAVALLALPIAATVPSFAEDAAAPATTEQPAAPAPEAPAPEAPAAAPAAEAPAPAAEAPAPAAEAPAPAADPAPAPAAADAPAAPAAPETPAAATPAETPAAPAAAAGDAPIYVGTWSEDAAACGLEQDVQDAPMIVSKDRFDQHEAHCEFKSVSGNASANEWKVTSECSVEGDKQTYEFGMSVADDKLAMVDDAGTHIYTRCTK